MMNKKISATFTFFIVALFFAAPAAADLAAVGPINPLNGYPHWYSDANGVRLDMTTPPLGDGLNPPTMIFDPPIAGNPLSEQIGFGAEAFYYLLEVVGDTGPVAGRPGGFVYVAALEMAWANELPAEGDQAVFQRIRIRVDIPDGGGGTYVVTHPYGVNTYENVLPGINGINDTADSPIVPISLVPTAFTFPLTGPIGPFVRQLAPVPPAGWLGDGASAATITGSPFGTNFFRIEGPNIGGPGVNVIQFDNTFTVAGHLQSAGVTIPISYFWRLPDGQSFVGVLAQSQPTQALTVSLPGTAAAPLAEVSPGLYHGFSNATAAGGAFSPVTLANNTDIPLTTATSVPIDWITISAATFSTSTRTLTVNAVSTDALGAGPALPVFSPIDGFVGFVVGGTVTTAPLTAQPPWIAVASSSGGVNYAGVTVVP